MIAAAGLYTIKATSQLMFLLSQLFPISVFEKDADRGSTPAKTTSIPPRAIIINICIREANKANSPRMSINTAPPPPVNTISDARFFPRQPEISHPKDCSMIQVEN